MAALTGQRRPEHVLMLQQNPELFDAYQRTPLHQLTGADLTQIDATGPGSALRLLAEIGPDMRRWPAENHVTSWLTLAPHNKITGGLLLGSATLPSHIRRCSLSPRR